MISNSNLRQSGFTLVSHTNEFVASMHLARSEAVKRGKVVRVTAANSSDSSNEWGPGWSVWVDLNSNSTMNTGEELRGAIDLTDNITLNSTGDVAEYRYNPDGSLGPGADIPDTLDICDSSRSGETRRSISLISTGRLSLDTSSTCP